MVLRDHLSSETKQLTMNGIFFIFYFFFIWEVDRHRPGDSETHGSRDGASRSDADSGLVPGEKKEAGSREQGEPGQGDRGTGGQRDPSCAGHGRGQAGRDGRRRQEQGEPGQGDRQTQRPELRRPRQRPGRPGWKKEAGEGRTGTGGQTDAETRAARATAETRQAGMEEEGRTRTGGQGDRETRTTRDTDSGLVPGWKKEGEGRLTDRDPGTERHTEAGMVRLGRMQTRAWSPGSRRKQGEPGQGDRGIGGQRDPDCAGHGLGLGPRGEEGRRKEKGEPGQGDGQTDAET
jgi:hypothetical protein